MNMFDSAAALRAYTKYAQSPENPNPFQGDHRPRLIVATTPLSRENGMDRLEAIEDVVILKDELSWNTQPILSVDQCYLLVTRTTCIHPKIVLLAWDTNGRERPTLVDYSDGCRDIAQLIT